MSSPLPVRRVGVVDQGTNTTLLLVADVEGAPGEESLTVVEDLCVTTRLGQGARAGGEFDPEAADRCLATLVDMGRRMDHHGVEVTRRRAVGTAVFRRVSREAAEAFCARVREASGLPLEVLGEEDEARLGHLAVARALGDPDAVIVDVGGGSTEVVTDRGSRRASVPIGALLLTERHLGLLGRPPTEPPPPGESGWERLVAEVEEACLGLPTTGEGSPGPAREVALLGGTGANLACLDLGLPAFDVGPAEGHVVPAEAAATWAERLRRMTLEERARSPIEEDRAEILPAGLACAAGALRRLGARRARITGRGLRYGLALELSTAPPPRGV